MRRIFKYISIISLIIISITSSSCDRISRSYCDTILNITDSNMDTISENSIIIAEECAKKYHKNIEINKKISQIHYINAANKHSSEQFFQSAESYYKALHYINLYLSQKKNIKKYDYQFRAEVFERLGDLYNELNIFKQTAELYDKSLSDYKKAENIEKSLNMLIKIGKLYRYNHIPDIAMIYFEMAEEYDNIPKNISRKIIDNKLVTLYELNDYNIADSIFENHFNTIIQDYDYHSVIGTKYFYERNYESALPHLKFCFDNGNIQEKLMASEKLAEAYFNLKDNENELIYIQHQAQSNSSEIRRTPLKLDLENIYDTNINEEIIIDKNSKYNKIALIFSTITIIIVVYLFITNRKNYRKKISEAEEAIRDSQINIKKKEKIIKDISKKLESIENENDFETSYKLFCESNIYNKIKHSLDGKTIMIKNVNEHSKYAISNNELIILTKTFNESFPNFIGNLKNEFEGITNSDIKFLILFIMDFSDTEIAVLLGLTYSATNKRSNKLKDIFNIEDNLGQFLLDYIKSNF